MGLSVGVSLVLGYSTFQQVFDGRYGLLPLSIWLSAMWLPIVSLLLLYRKGFHVPRVRMPVVLYVVLLTIFGLRLFFITQTDHVMLHGDEAIISHRSSVLFETASITGNWDLLGYEMATVSDFPALWYYVQGGIMHLLGPSVFSAKLLALITDFAIVVLGYWLVRRWYGSMVAFAFVMLYSVFPVAVHFGMTGYQNIQSSLFFITTLVFLEKSRDEDAVFWAYFAGVSAGLGLYCYLVSVLVPPIGLLGAVLLIRREKWQEHLGRIVWYLLGVGLSVIPYLALFTGGHNFIEGRASTYDGVTATGITKVFFAEWRTFVYGMYEGWFNGSGRHYIDAPFFTHWLLLVLFAIGMVWMLFRFRRRLFEHTMVFVSVFCMICLGILTDRPPAAQRLLFIIPLACLIFAIGIHTISEVARYIGKGAVWYRVSFASLTVLIVVWSVHQFYSVNVAYYRNYPRGEYYFVQTITSEPTLLPVAVYAQPHKIDYLYLYGEGKLDLTRVLYSDDLSAFMAEHDEAWLVESKLLHRPLTYSGDLLIEQHDYKPFERMYLYKIQKNPVL